MSSVVETKSETLSEMIQRSNQECDQVYVIYINHLISTYFVFTIFLHRIRSARIKEILDNCLATNELDK